MQELGKQLILDSCPHCGRANPVLTRVSAFIETEDHARTNKRWWCMYKCTTCGYTITAGGYKQSNNATQTGIRWIYPSTPTISESIPDKAREFLRQAQNTFHAPTGAIMLCASAIDAMLIAGITRMNTPDMNNPQIARGIEKLQDLFGARNVVN